MSQKKVSAKALGARFASPYSSTFADNVETDFLEMRTVKPLVWPKYIDDIFFIWNESKEKFQ